MRSATGMALAVLLTAGCAQELPIERRAIADAIEAMGGQSHIVGTATLVMEGEGQAYNFGQNRRPEADLPVFEITEYRRVIDYAHRQSRVEQTRAAQFATGLSPVVRQVMALDGDVAFNVAPDGTATRLPGRAALDRYFESYHTPIGIMKAAINGNNRVNNGRTDGPDEAVDVTTADGHTFTLVVDGTTRLPVRVSSMTYHTNLGDMQVETEFSDYAEVDGLMLPGRIRTRYDRWIVSDLRIARTIVNPELDDLAAPAAARQAPAEPPAPVVEAEEVARGLWYLTGGSHHSVVVEFSDHLVLVEAPQNEARTLAVIERARELQPDKPLAKVVISHHHFDHSGGLRAAVAEGLTVVAQENNRAHVEEVVSRPHTIHEDALARNPASLELETFDDELVMEDATRRVVLYHIAGSPHADTLMMAYLPRERMLVQADTFGPPAPDAETMPRFPFIENLLSNVQDRGLRVDRHMPLHGRIVSSAEFMRAVNHERAQSQTE